MPTPRSVAFEWASAVTAPKAEPPTSLKLAGWEPGISVPSGEHVNWLFWAASQLADMNGGLRYEDLAAAVLDFTTLAGAAIEGTFIVDEFDGDGRPGDVVAVYNPPAAVVSVDVDSSRVYFIQNGGGNGLSRSRDFATAGSTFALPGGATASATSRIVSNGATVAISHTQFVTAYSTDGTLLWTYDHGATIRDICITGTGVFLCGDLGTGNKHVRRIIIATGLASWSYRHATAGSLKSIACNGRQVFVAGEPSDYASLATIRALNAANGNDFNNEGGTAADAANMAWDDVQVSYVRNNKCMACDGTSLWVGYPAWMVGMTLYVSPREIERRDAATGHVVAYSAVSPFGRNVIGIAVDHDALFALHAGASLGAASHMVRYDKWTLAPAWSSADVALHAPYVIATDGFGVFTGSGAAGYFLARTRRMNRAILCRRIDPSDEHLPLRLLAIPQGA